MYLQEEVVTYEVAKLASEAGFKSFTRSYYMIGDKEPFFVGEANNWNVHYDKYSAPTKSLLQKWLRKEKGIYIEVYIDWEDSIEYNMIRYSWKVATAYRAISNDIVGYDKNESEVYFDTYELALEDALKYTLENLV